jgi:hypothetical protein
MLVAAARASNPLRGSPLGGGARGIHFNAYIPRSSPPPRSTPASTSYQYYSAQASRIAQSTRRFFARLLEPSLPAHVHGGHQAHITLQGLAQLGVHRHPNPILRNLSPTSKFSLAHSPVSRVYLPRGPQGLKTVGYRGLAQEVGLGTARNFSTGRTVFHHVVEKNASIGVRAFLEADTDLRTVQMSRMGARKAEKKMKKETNRRVFKQEPLIVKTKEKEIARYFKDEEPEMITYLQVALAATPSARMPFAASANGSIDSNRLLPLRAMLNTQQQFHAQSEFVSSLFNRMDGQGVWNSPRGRVTVESWGDLNGLCTELRVRFERWSEEDVRALFSGLLANEATGGWAIQELYPPMPYPARVLQTSNGLTTLAADSIPASMLASPALSNAESEMELEDPWASGPDFIMPQLDFSSSFPVYESLPNSIFDESLHDHETLDNDFDHISDAGSEAWSETAESSMSMPSVLSIDTLSASRVTESVSGWIGFSSDLLGRIQEDNSVFF